MIRQIPIILFIAAIINGCALSDEVSSTQPPSRLPDLPLLPSPVFEGSCEDDPRLLEVWLGTSILERERLQTLIGEIAVDGINDLEQLGAELTQIQYRIHTLVTPNCAEITHNLLLSLLNLTYQVFQQYADGKINNIADALADEQYQIILDGVVAEQDRMVEEFTPNNQLDEQD